MSDQANGVQRMANAPTARQQSPRAVRNNNPGNIERGTRWIGLMPESEMTTAQRQENRFAVFKHPKYGFRAMATVILTYARKRRAQDGSAIDTINDVIARWAPPVENNTPAYARRVAEAVGVKPDELVDLESFAVLKPMIKAMSIVEAGGWFFKEPDLDEGLRLVGVVRPNPSTVTKAEGTAAAVGTATAAAGATAEIVRQTSDLATAAGPAISTWQQMYSVLPTVALVVAVGALAFLAYRWIVRTRRTTA